MDAPTCDLHFHQDDQGEYQVNQSLQPLPPELCSLDAAQLPTQEAASNLNPNAA